MISLVTERNILNQIFLFVICEALLLTFGPVRGQECADEVDSAVCHLMNSFNIENLCTDPCLSKTCRKTCGTCQIIIMTPSPTGFPSEALPGSTCRDFNETLCTQLAFTMPNICSNDCLASTVCPEMCGKCLSCCECDGILQPSACSTTTTCGSNEKCFIRENINSLTYGRDYKMGIVFFLPVYFTLTSECHGNFNIPEMMIVIGMVVVLHHFFLYDNNCYNFGPEEQEWADALGYCRQRCSHLAELKNDFDIQSVMNYFDGMPLSGYNRDEDYYVGAVDMGVGRWKWYNSGDEVDYDLIRPSYHAHRYDHCATVRAEDNDFSIGNERCYSKFRPMCEIRAK